MRRGLSDVCVECELRPTRMYNSHYTRKCAEQHLPPPCNGFIIDWFCCWFLWFVQWWWRILSAWQCVWNYTQSKGSHTMLIVHCKMLVAFAASCEKDLGANYSKLQWLPLQPSCDSQYCVDTGHHWLGESTSGNQLNIPRSLQCVTRHIFYYSIWPEIGG